jgi:hypothetical protein
VGTGYNLVQLTWDLVEYSFLDSELRIPLKVCRIFNFKNNVPNKYDFDVLQISSDQMENFS